MKKVNWKNIMFAFLLMAVVAGLISITSVKNVNAEEANCGMEYIGCKSTSGANNTCCADYVECKGLPAGTQCGADFVPGDDGDGEEDSTFGP